MRHGHGGVKFCTLLINLGKISLTTFQSLNLPVIRLVETGGEGRFTKPLETSSPMKETSYLFLSRCHRVHDKAEIEMAIRKYCRMQERDIYRHGIYKLAPTCLRLILKVRHFKRISKLNLKFNNLEIFDTVRFWYHTYLFFQQMHN